MSTTTTTINQIPETPSEEWVISNILNHRHTDNGVEYLVNYDGYGSEANNWVPASLFEDRCALRMTYWERNRVTG